MINLSDRKGLIFISDSLSKTLAFSKLQMADYECKIKAEKKNLISPANRCFLMVKSEGELPKDNVKNRGRKRQS